MDTKQLTKDIIIFNKNNLENNFQAMKALYEQNEKIINLVWEQSPFLPQTSKKALSGFLASYKQSCHDLKDMATNHLKKAEEYFIE